ncbi:GntR family transcriptional regulator [Saccharopolyspora mangrovi]|uniref:GntR family transcriptional regulator n=1 Tax=Saccharopolyspora mangrovi TaxID=3082379 RepID=A0ABU6A9P0_9PSEU|nr:GntR family transcriptional regulator [Saccharopolyspora sp. S2-29]MEB3368070.1 GntR family transcriptional regulator [Saccharopolyspora sp. S2-29]
MGKVDPDDPRPPYQQIADDLRSEIRSGELAAGQRLPRQSDLVSRYDVALGTVKSALAVLRDEGLIVSRKGEGAWVRREALDEPQDEEAAPDAASMLAEVLDRLEVINERLTSIEKRLPQG